MDEARKLLSLIPSTDIYQAFCSHVHKCNGCLLHKTRHTVVIGDGRINADVMIIGEAPGEEEDEAGKPFVGKAGKHLDKILKFVGLNRHDNLYITNTILCRPPNNRTPLYHEEMMKCRYRLMCHVYMVKPKLLILLGRAAVQSVLQIEDLKESLTNLAEKNDLTLKIEEHSADMQSSQTTLIRP
jgi:DNA polymerase